MKIIDKSEYSLSLYEMFIKKELIKAVEEKVGESGVESVTVYNIYHTYKELGIAEAENLDINYPDYFDYEKYGKHLVEDNSYYWNGKYIEVWNKYDAHYILEIEIKLEEEQ